MKILILTDMEGITGVTRWRHVNPAHAEHARFRHLMTADVNAAVAGARSAGADEVIVTDGHEDGTNILVEELVGVNQFNSGLSSPLSVFQGIQDKPDAVLCVGYHARSGTMNAICDHTCSGHIYDLYLNDRLCGEFGLSATVCGQFGIPVLFVSGDQAVCAEAREWVKGVETAEVKQATGRFSAQCLPPQATAELIKAGAARAVQALSAGNAPKPLPPVHPVKLTVDFRNTSLAESAAKTEGAQRINGRRVEITCEDALAACLKLRSLLKMADE